MFRGQGYGNQLIVPIVPYWNWNTTSWTVPASLQPVPIVPYWNWNIIRTAAWDWFTKVPIVPYWNWNIIVSVWIIRRTCSNRTLLELKYNTKQRFSNCRSNVPIVPYWNWNIWKRLDISRCAPFQSYLTGIEINFVRVRRRVGKQFQSYLTGIEIFQFVHCLSVPRRSNRTLLELK